MAQVSHIYRNVIESILSKSGIHRAQAQLLYWLYGRDGISHTDIARKLALHGATVTRMLNRMETAGLIQRIRDTSDQRLVRVYLTDAGREQEYCLKHQFEQIEAKTFEGICTKKLRLLRHLLHQILHNLNGKQPPSFPIDRQSKR